MRIRSLAAVLSPLLAGCSSSNTTGDARAPDSGGGPDGGTTAAMISFEIERIDGVGIDAPTVGDNATLSLDSNGSPTVAYASVPQGTSRFEIWFATRQSDGTWSKERATVPNARVPTASGQTVISHTHVGGVPHIVYLGGDDDGIALTPFPTDLMLATKQGAGWMERTLADTSGEAPGVCPGTQDTCNFGNVVGSHAAIARNPSGSGFAVVYRDTHGGFARDDLARSDVEVYAEGGPVSRSVVDPVRSGGAFGAITYTRNGGLVVAYNLEAQSGPDPRTGVWAGAYDGSTWRLVRVSESQTGSRLALGTARSGTIYLALSHSNDTDLVVATSEDDGRSWSPTIVDSAGRTGLHPAITFDTEDRPLIAYGYCGRQTDSDCPARLGARSEARVARLEGAEWKIYKVDDGQGAGSVGLFNSIVVTGDGKMGIAFVDDGNGDLLYAREL